MRLSPWFAAIGLASTALAQTSPTSKGPVDQLIPSLLDEDQQLRGIPLSELIFDATGRNVVPFEANNTVDQRVAKAISAACDETMKRLNAPNSEIQHVDRINEVSSHFEDTLQELLNATPGLQCDFPFTVEGKSNVQVIQICASSIWRANACSIWTRSFMPLEVVTAVFALFISSRRSLPTKCAMTQCISSLDLSMRHAKPEQVLPRHAVAVRRRRRRHGNSRDEILSIFRGLSSS